MTNKPWKRFERDVGKLIGGKRYPANLGGGVDVESPYLVIQCKNVKTMPLAALEKLANEIAIEGKESEKVGVVCINRHGGTGQQRTGIESLFHLHQADAGLRIAVSNGRLNWRRAAPPRQQRRMHIHAAPARY